MTDQKPQRPAGLPLTLELSESDFALVGDLHDWVQAAPSCVDLPDQVWERISDQMEEPVHEALDDAMGDDHDFMVVSVGRVDGVLYADIVHDDEDDEWPVQIVQAPITVSEPPAGEKDNA